MDNWESNSQREARLRREREEHSNSLWGHTLWTAGAIAIAALAYAGLKNNNFELVIGEIKKAFVQEQNLPQEESPQQARNTLPYKEDESSELPQHEQQQPQNDVTTQPPQQNYATPRRSVQEEYELASRITESQSAQLKQARVIDNRIQFGGFYFEDQSTFDQWWLGNYERECLPYGRGSINYRHCRANWKDRVMDECRDRKLNFERLESSDRDAARPINEAQCYAANNYRIVE